MSLEGLRFDTIEVLYEVGWDNNYPPKELDLPISWSSCFERLACYPTNEDLLTAFRLTICADATLEDSAASEDPCHGFNFASMQHFSDVNGTCLRDGSIGNWKRFAASVYTASAARRLFVTTAGYIGLCPRYSAIGDRVCVLLGGDTPYIIRQENEYQTFIGACYVHGIMDGEAMEIARQRHWPTEVFNLRQAHLGPCPACMKDGWCVRVGIGARAIKEGESCMLCSRDRVCRLAWGSGRTFGRRILEEQPMGQTMHSSVSLEISTSEKCVKQERKSVAEDFAKEIFFSDIMAPKLLDHNT